MSAPIFLDFMGKFLQKQDQQNYERLVLEAKQEAERLGIDYQEPEPLAPLDFNVPEGVEPFWINKQGGYRSDSSDSGAILEYFKKGTEPPPAPQREAEDDYWQSPIM